MSCSLNKLLEGDVKFVNKFIFTLSNETQIKIVDFTFDLNSQFKTFDLNSWLRNLILNFLCRLFFILSKEKNTQQRGLFAEFFLLSVFWHSAKSGRKKHSPDRLTLSKEPDSGSDIHIGHRTNTNGLLLQCSYKCLSFQDGCILLLQSLVLLCLYKCLQLPQFSLAETQPYFKMVVCIIRLDPKLLVCYGWSYHLCTTIRQSKCEVCYYQIILIQISSQLAPTSFGSSLSTITWLPFNQVCGFMCVFPICLIFPATPKWPFWMDILCSPFCLC